MTMGIDDTDYLWLDLSRDLAAEDVGRLAFNPDLVEIQATPLFKSYDFVDYEVNIDDKDYSRYFEEAKAEIQQYGREPFVPFANEEVAAGHTDQGSTSSRESNKGSVLGGRLLKQISKVVHKKPSMQTLPDPEASSPTPAAAPVHAHTPSAASAAAAAAAAASAAIDLTQMKKGVTSLWNAMKSATMNTISTGTTASSSSALSLPEVSAHLQALFNAINVPFSNTNPQHIELLREMHALTAARLTQKEYERCSDQWKAVGFQKDDPLLDVKTTGLLFLQSLVYFCKTYPSMAVGMMARNQVNTKVNYPFAIVGINLTLLLIEVFQLRDQKYLLNATGAGYWDLFIEEHAFMEVFCCCFAHLDHLWTHRKASRAEFGSLINEVKGLVVQVLSHNPKSLEDFRLMGQAEGMLVVGM